jgi:hypothetical protein
MTVAFGQPTRQTITGIERPFHVADESKAGVLAREV